MDAVPVKSMGRELKHFVAEFDDCVMAVHAGYVAGDFQCLLDSDLFLPREWASDPLRRAEVGVRLPSCIPVSP